VTGHRRLDDEAALAARIRDALERARTLVPPTAATPVLLTVVSSLAEGADRLVAREVLADEIALLEVPLPLPLDRYRGDFETEASSREFDELLALAITVIEPETSWDAEDGYARVGRFVVARCDVLLALWDGLPARGEGGTAEIVEYARSRGKPVLWIQTERDPELVDRHGDTPAREAFERLDEFNRASVPEGKLVEGRARVRERDARSVMGAVDAVGPEQADRLSAWILPFLTRADHLALRFQRRFYRLTGMLYLAAVLAVAVVAVQAIVFPEHPELVWAEVVLLALLLLVVFYGRRQRLHRRWISYRFLAERFRSAFFLAAAGLGQRLEGGLERVGDKNPSEDWLQRAFAEVWNRRPKDEPGSGLESLRTFLADRWIGEQRRYYAKARDRQERRHRFLLAAIYAAFLATIGAAVPHALGVGHAHAEGVHFSVGELFSILSITLPALGAALGGLLAQREYHRNADRYDWMERSLEEAEKQMRSAPTVDEVRRAAAAAEATLLQENRDWVGVMRFHDFELV
jgi:hypothetical protein